MAHQMSSEDTNRKAQQRMCHVFLLIIGLGCVLQATLNVSLRLALPSQFCLECNLTCPTSPQPVMTSYADFGRNPRRCIRLQERLNALTRERDELRNSVSQLRNWLQRCK